MSRSTTTAIAQVVSCCHALADETRLGIIDLLVEGERCVCELTDALRTSQSRLSFHLKTLKDAGLVRDRRDGRWNYYELNREAFEALREYLDGLNQGGRLRMRSAKACE